MNVTANRISKTQYAESVTGAIRAYLTGGEEGELINASLLQQPLLRQRVIQSIVVTESTFTNATLTIKTTPSSPDQVMFLGIFFEDVNGSPSGVQSQSPLKVLYQYYLFNGADNSNAQNLTLTWNVATVGYPPVENCVTVSNSASLLLSGSFSTGFMATSNNSLQLQTLFSTQLGGTTTTSEFMESPRPNQLSIAALIGAEVGTSKAISRNIAVNQRIVVTGTSMMQPFEGNSITPLVAFQTILSEITFTAFGDQYGQALFNILSDVDVSLPTFTSNARVQVSYSSVFQNAPPNDYVYLTIYADYINSNADNSYTNVYTQVVAQAQVIVATVNQTTEITLSGELINPQTPGSPNIWILLGVRLVVGTTTVPSGPATVTSSFIAPVPDPATTPCSVTLFSNLTTGLSFNFISTQYWWVKPNTITTPVLNSHLKRPFPQDLKLAAQEVAIRLFGGNGLTCVLTEDEYGKLRRMVCDDHLLATAIMAGNPGCHVLHLMDSCHIHVKNDTEPEECMTLSASSRTIANFLKTNARRLKQGFDEARDFMETAKPYVEMGAKMMATPRLQSSFSASAVPNLWATMRPTVPDYFDPHLNTDDFTTYVHDRLSKFFTEDLIKCRTKFRVLYDSLLPGMFYEHTLNEFPMLTTDEFVQFFHAMVTLNDMRDSVVERTFEEQPHNGGAPVQVFIVNLRDSEYAEFHQLEEALPSIKDLHVALLNNNVEFHASSDNQAKLKRFSKVVGALTNGHALHLTSNHVHHPGMSKFLSGHVNGDEMKKNLIMGDIVHPDHITAINNRLGDHLHYSGSFRCMEREIPDNDLDEDVEIVLNPTELVETTPLKLEDSMNQAAMEAARQAKYEADQSRLALGRNASAALTSGKVGFSVDWFSNNPGKTKASCILKLTNSVYTGKFDSLVGVNAARFITISNTSDPNSEATPVILNLILSPSYVEGFDYFQPMEGADLYVSTQFSESAEVSSEVLNVARSVIGLVKSQLAPVWIFVSGDAVIPSGAIKGNSFGLALFSAWMGLPSGPVLTGSIEGGSIKPIGDTLTKLAAINVSNMIGVMPYNGTFQDITRALPQANIAMKGIYERVLEVNNSKRDSFNALKRGDVLLVSSTIDFINSYTGCLFRDFSSIYSSLIESNIQVLREGSTLAIANAYLTKGSVLKTDNELMAADIIKKHDNFEDAYAEARIFDLPSGVIDAIRRAYEGFKSDKLNQKFKIHEEKGKIDKEENLVAQQELAQTTKLAKTQLGDILDRLVKNSKTMGLVSIDGSPIVVTQWETYYQGGNLLKAIGSREKHVVDRLANMLQGVIKKVNKSPDPESGQNYYFYPDLIELKVPVETKKKKGKTANKVSYSGIGFSAINPSTAPVNVVREDNSEAVDKMMRM